MLLLSLWNSLFDGRVPAALSPTVSRTLYFKLPIAGTRFHWTFLDRRAFLSGELTLRILNTREKRDQTLVIFRDGKISDGWAMIGKMPRDSSVYFGFETQERFPTTVGDSLVITLVAREDLRGRGPHSEGTLPKGTWVGHRHVLRALRRHAQSTPGPGDRGGGTRCLSPVLGHGVVAHGRARRRVDG